MKAPLILLLAAAAPVISGCQKAPSPAPYNGPMALAIPEKGAYTGAYIDFGDNEDNVTLEQIEDFENLVGKHQAIVASSSYWGEQSFPTANLTLIWKHGSIPLVFWSPWDRPYEEDRGPDKFSLTAILAGKWNDYIDRWAMSAKEFGHPMMVSFANEPNGTWFPWSGCYYGGGKAATADPSAVPTPTPAWKPKVPIPYQGPETFKKAFRYVVDRLRAKGAHNVIWVFHIMNYSIPAEYWNLVAQYYPGADYVDWLGFSVYGEQYREDNWATFLPLLEWPYQEISLIDKTKPIMLAEWGVGEFSSKGSKPAFISEAFHSMSAQFPRLKAAVFWHERWQNEDTTYSNLRVNSSPESLAAYRRGVAHPFWLGFPELIARRP